MPDDLSSLSEPAAPIRVTRPEEPLPHAPTVPPKLGRFLWGTLLLAGAGLLAGGLPRWRQRAFVREETRSLAVQSVHVVRAAPSKAAAPLHLSGELKPQVEADIYARTNGYVRRWMVDLGAQVEAGQLLAELDTPDLDRELSQTQAELKQAEAARDLSVTTAKRWEHLVANRAVSPQEAEEKRADAALKQAALQAAQARVERLIEIQRFAKITAPFAGTVLARQLDVGQLVNAGTTHPLFRIAVTHRLRVFVRVPQNYARAVTASQNATLTVPELPSRTFAARVVRTAAALDPVSRTLLAELEVDNPNADLFAGSYATVQLQDARPEIPLSLPAQCIFFRAEGALVGVVGTDQHVALRKVSLGRDLGHTVEILSGVTAADNVILNPPDALVDGVEVRIHQPSGGI
jgi:membrane fusion protein (multidrug efflux system)